MSDPKPILAYAFPAGSQPSSDDATVFTFAAPPIRPEVRMNAFVLILCCVAGAIMLGFAIREEWKFSHNGDGNPVNIIIGLGGAAGTLAVGFARILEIKRLRRFGDDPIRIEITPPTILIYNPIKQPQLKSLNIADITDIKLRAESKLLTGVNIFVIAFRLGLLREFPVRVAVHDRGIINRAVDDLRNALKHPDKSKFEPQMNADERR